MFVYIRIAEFLISGPNVGFRQPSARGISVASSSGRGRFRRRFRSGGGWNLSAVRCHLLSVLDLRPHLKPASILTG